MRGRGGGVAARREGLVLFLAVVFFAEVLAVFFALVFFAVVFLALEEGRAEPERDFAVVFLVVFLGVFLAAVFRDEVFLDVVFLRDADGLRVVFAPRAEAFLVGVLRVVFLATVFLEAPEVDLFVEVLPEPDLRAAVFFAGLMAAGR